MSTQAASNNPQNGIPVPPIINGIQQSLPGDMVMNNYQTMVHPPIAGQISNFSPQYIQIGAMTNGGNNLQLGTVPMFDPSNTAPPFPVGTPMTNHGISNDHFTQLLPQLHPMKAVPICVTALSHGAPHTSHQRELGAPGANPPDPNRAPSSFSPQRAGSAPVLRGAYGRNQSFAQGVVRLPHPGENLGLGVYPNVGQAQGLAAVPKQKLSNFKSIASIRRGFTESGKQTELQRKEQTETLSTSNVQKVMAPHYRPSDPTPAASTITKKQMEDRQQSSYSSACNATIMAQQKLSAEQQQQVPSGKNGHIGIEQDENDTKDQANMSLAGGANTATTFPPAINSLNYTNNTSGTGTGTKRNLDGNARAINNDETTVEFTQDVTMKKLEPQHKYVQVVGGKVDSLNLPSMSPHDYLQKLLVSRGYSTKHYCSLEGGYYCRPTPLQCASYGISVVNAVRTSNTNLFKAFLSAGLSRNPCNKFGESILHMVCRRGDQNLLKLLLDHGSTVQVSDDFGRTPLHDACWTVKPNFKSIEMLLERDVRLFHIVDCRGSPPLEYVKKESWGEWIQFFDSKKEVFWPHRNVLEESEEGPPQLVNVPPHARPVSDPENCATLDDATMFSSGTKSPV